MNTRFPFWGCLHFPANSSGACFEQGERPAGAYCAILCTLSLFFLPWSICTCFFVSFLLQRRGKGRIRDKLVSAHSKAVFHEMPAFVWYPKAPGKWVDCPACFSVVKQTDLEIKKESASSVIRNTGPTVLCFACTIRFSIRNASGPEPGRKWTWLFWTQRLVGLAVWVKAAALLTSVWDASASYYAWYSISFMQASVWTVNACKGEFLN